MSKVVFDADKIRKTLTFEIPSVPGSELVLNKSITVGEEKILAAKHPHYNTKDHRDQMEFMKSAIFLLLKSWNLTDAEGNDIPLDQAPQIFEQIPSSDLGKLMKQFELENKDTLADSGLSD